MKAEDRWLQVARESPKAGAFGIEGMHGALKHLLRCLKDLESFLGPELLGLQGEENPLKPEDSVFEGIQIGRAHV